MEEEKKPDRNVLIEMLYEMAKTYENLPPHAMTSPVMLMDHYNLVLLLSAIFKAEIND